VSVQRFDECLSIVLKFEGGLSDHPLDRGGRTNFGVTQSTYDRYRKSLGLPPQDVAKITKDEVREIYYRFYWTPSKADKMPQPLDLLVFDTAVNCGVLTAVRLLRRVLSLWGLTPRWTDDVLRDDVISVLWKVAKEPNKLKGLCFDYLSARRDYYLKIVERNPSQKVFLRGWLNRVQKLKQIVEKHFSPSKE